MPDVCLDLLLLFLRIILLYFSSIRSYIRGLVETKQPFTEVNATAFLFLFVCLLNISEEEHQDDKATSFLLESKCGRNDMMDN